MFCGNSGAVFVVVVCDRCVDRYFGSAKPFGRLNFELFVVSSIHDFGFFFVICLIDS